MHVYRLITPLATVQTLVLFAFAKFIFLAYRTISDSDNLLYRLTVIPINTSQGRVLYWCWFA
jgi:hypothetical protein